MTPNDTWGSCLGNTTTQPSLSLLRDPGGKGAHPTHRGTASHCTSLSPVLPAYKALSHRNIRKPSFTAYITDHWLDLCNNAGGLEKTLDHPAPQSTEVQTIGLSFM